ncbi:dephospho-CoA kinase [Ligilactobacillus aviarius]|uniref:dephospho-CoA kinase n=1 Tax=Ligilactobacillus aviarius TaxID=1606 RepID=UPI003209AA83
MTYVLGLTGGIASGKSTVSKILASYGAEIIDGDVIARRLQQPGEEGLRQIELQFGKEYLNADGSLNRTKLGDLVFNDPAELAKLNHIMRPLIHQQIIERVNQAKKAKVKLAVIDIALLIEGHYLDLCTNTMMIETTSAKQLSNLMNRNHLSKARAQARINAQMSNCERAKYVDEVITNNGSVEELKLKMIKWLTSKHLLGSEVE